MDVLKQGTDDPGVIPMYSQMHTDQFADQPAMHCLPDITEVRRTPGVLIDREFSVVRASQIHQSLACVQIQYKRLLAENMLAGSQRIRDQRQTLFRVRGDVHDLDISTRQEIPVIGVNVCFRIELFLPLERPLRYEVAERDDVVTSACIGLKMGLGNASARDQSDGR